MIKTPALKTIGIVGTAKNTGKTTALIALAGALEAARKKVALTSIGYDGEAVDSLTLLPKPRIDLPAGALVATAERCLENARLKADLTERTGISTALGEVLILRVTAPGRMVVAGPNQREGLAQVISMLEEAGSDIVLVDGAMARIAPMAAADGIIFTTGAARSTDLGALAREMQAIHALLSLPVHDRTGMEDASSARITIHTEDGQVRDTGISTLLDREQVEILLGHVPSEPHVVRLPGLILADVFDVLRERLDASIGNMHLVAEHPFLLLLGGEPARVGEAIESFQRGGGRVSVRRAVPLLGVTVNPFYPRRFQGKRFTPAYVDKTVLKDQIAAALPVPVSNIHADGPSSLLQACSLS